MKTLSNLTLISDREDDTSGLPLFTSKALFVAGTGCFEFTNIGPKKCEGSRKFPIAWLLQLGFSRRLEWLKKPFSCVLSLSPKAWQRGDAFRSTDCFVCLLTVMRATVRSARLLQNATAARGYASPSECVVLSKDSNQALGIAEFALDFMNGKGTPDDEVHRCTLDRFVLESCAVEFEIAGAGAHSPVSH